MDEARRRWEASHPDAVRAIRRRWYLRHRAEQIERMRAYRRQVKELRAAHEQPRPANATEGEAVSGVGRGVSHPDGTAAGCDGRRRSGGV